MSHSNQTLYQRRSLVLMIPLIMSHLIRIIFNDQSLLSNFNHLKKQLFF